MIQYHEGMANPPIIQSTKAVTPDKEEYLRRLALRGIASTGWTVAADGTHTHWRAVWS